MDLAPSGQVRKGARYGPGAATDFQHHGTLVKFDLRLVARAHGDLLGIGSPKLEDSRQTLKHAAIGGCNLGVDVSHWTDVS